MVEQHTHNGVDSPAILNTHLRDAYKDSEVVHLTGDETIAGVKTFTSTPVLPASNPTTDNQAARKAYVDSLLDDTEVIAGSTNRDSAITPRSSSSATYEKKKEIQFNDVPGTIRVLFSLEGAIDGTSKGRIYVNGTAVGTERTGTGPATVYSEDISVATGDLVQIYLKNNAQVLDFILRYDKIFKVTAGTVNLN